VVWEAFRGFRRRSSILRIWPWLNLVRLGFSAARPDGFDLDKSVAYRVNGLADKDARVREGHAGLLGRLGAKAQSAIPALLNAQDDPDLEVRRIADNALGQVTTPASLPALIRGTRHSRPRVRAAACSHLWKYSSQGKVAVSALLACLRDDEAPEVRRRAAQSLAHYDAHADLVVPALVKALDDKDPGEVEVIYDQGDKSRIGVPHYAVRSLGSFQGRARAAIPALLKAARSHDPWLRVEVIEAFGVLSFTTPAIEKAVTDALDDKNGHVRDAAEVSVRRLLVILRKMRKSSR
jgi:HEAT repeat protein